jgi:hypothetical protein
MPLDIKKDLRMKFLKEKAWKKIWNAHEWYDGTQK